MQAVKKCEKRFLIIWAFFLIGTNRICVYITHIIADTTLLFTTFWAQLKYSYQILLSQALVMHPLTTFIMSSIIENKDFFRDKLLWAFYLSVHCDWRDVELAGSATHITNSSFAFHRCSPFRRWYLSNRQFSAEGFSWSGQVTPNFTLIFFFWFIEKEREEILYHFALQVFLLCRNWSN